MQEPTKQEKQKWWFNIKTLSDFFFYKTLL